MTAWLPDILEFHRETLPKLEKLGIEIGKKAQEGDELCIKIMGNYELLYKSFDPMTHHTLKEEIKQYETSMARPN